STSDRFKSSNVDIIEAYVNAGGEGIVLTDLQEKMLDRFRYADEKIRQGHGRFKRDEIAGMIKVTFGVSRDTAYKDIVNTERIFSSSFPLNKRYEIGNRIEFLKEQIRFAAAGNDWKAVGMMEKVLELYYRQYPDIIKVDTKKNIIMNVVQQFFDTPEATAMALEEAIQIAEIIEDEPDDI
ncbi:MAG: hypothetical protein ABI921_13250, partial [Panacibacter sp.]